MGKKHLKSVPPFLHDALLNDSNKVNSPCRITEDIKMRKTAFLILFSLVIFTGFLCNNSEDEKTISATGTVKYFNLEGGFYGIVTDQGGHFLPENLSDEFKQDNLRVYFEGVITDKVTIQQWGRTIKIRKIEKIQ